MNPRKILLGLALVGVLGLVLWQVTRHHATPAPTGASVAQTPAPASVVPAATPTPPAAQAPVVTAPVAAGAPALPPSTALVANPSSAAPSRAPAPTPQTQPEANPEQAATARMYAAHAPLRAPVVADPDSATNKRILGAMVAKMLAQPATPPPAPAAAAHP